MTNEVIVPTAQLRVLTDPYSPTEVRVVLRSLGDARPDPAPLLATGFQADGEGTDEEPGLYLVRRGEDAGFRFVLEMTDLPEDWELFVPDSWVPEPAE